MSRAVPAPILVALFVACVPVPYEDGPPPERRSEPAAGEAATVVGHVSPGGTLVADTLERAQPDTVRVERETVVTGEIRPAAELEVRASDGAGEGGARLATGWRVQVFASRAESEAATVATRVRSATGDAAPVYVEWDDPWYKVRVGDHSDRAEAERVRERLMQLGWPEAWVVRTTIRTVP